MLNLAANSNRPLPETNKGVQTISLALKFWLQSYFIIGFKVTLLNYLDEAIFLVCSYCLSLHCQLSTQNKIKLGT
jgi:hypothetical protein